MITYLSFLRGINVSGHKMIKMEALRRMYERLGFTEVKSYIQSGNLIFRFKKTTHRYLEKKISKEILNEFGFEVPVLVIGLEEIKTVLQNNPFLNTGNEDNTKLHVTFLSGIPSQYNIDELNKVNYAPDEFVIDGKCIYLFCADGYGNTKLSNTFFENKLKVRATTRNWKTVGEILKLRIEN
jgi:uncharacterized protein (DUF1697 family)